MDNVCFACKLYKSLCFYQDCGSNTRECISGDWFGEVREVDLADLKQEPDDVCFILCLPYSFSCFSTKVELKGHTLSDSHTHVIVNTCLYFPKMEHRQVSKICNH